MECKTARLFLPLAAELGKEEADALQAHLAICGDCDATARATQREHAHFARAMNDVPVPVGLKGRILDKLATAQTIEWRKWALRIVRPLTAVAATLFLISLGVLLYSILWPTEIDPKVVANTENYTRLTGAEEADESLPRLGFPACAPDFVNYAHLLGQPVRGPVPGYPGLQVPTFYFVERTDNKARRAAVIYVFKAGQIKNREPVETGPWWAEVYRAEPDGRWDYLILYTDRDWGWLRQAPAPPAEG